MKENIEHKEIEINFSKEDFEGIKKAVVDGTTYESDFANVRNGYVWGRIDLNAISFEFSYEDGECDHVCCFVLADDLEKSSSTLDYSYNTTKSGKPYALHDDAPTLSYGFQNVNYEDWLSNTKKAILEFLDKYPELDSKVSSKLNWINEDKTEGKE